MAAPARSRKVLVSGDPGGRLGALLKRVAAVNKANGPFDALLCVGSFFPPSGPEGDAEAGEDLELTAWLAAGSTAPVPTYFIGAFGRVAAAGMAALLRSGAAADVHYLGRAGVAQVAGLNVAFLDGLHSQAALRQPLDDSQPTCRYFSEADILRVKQAAANALGDIDILLTCDWPAHITAGLPPGAPPAEAAQAPGSSAVADVAEAVRPRYHFVGGRGTFWARPPYANKDLGAGSHVTRFISLAEVGNAAKQKSLHALALVPAADMEADALTQQPEGTTASPYDADLRAKRQREDDALGEQGWRWAGKKARPDNPAPSRGRADVVKDDRKTVFVRNLPFRASEADLIAHFGQAGRVADVRRGANDEGRLNAYAHIQYESEDDVARAVAALNGQPLMGRELFVDAAANKPPEAAAAQGKPVEGCWFCLSNPGADVSLVASIGEESYVAVDKGAITPLHVLLLPIEHYASTLKLPPACWAEMERYLSALQSCYAAQGKDLVAFERFMTFRKSGGNHCHLNVIGVPAAVAAKAQQAFEAAGAEHGMDWTELAPARGEAARAALRDAVGDGEFFAAHLPGGRRLVHAIKRGARHPLSFGRDVIARLAGVPERADWKVCALSPEEEEQRTAAFKQLFQPYDIMQ